jgi:ATP-dependent RNA helicase HelY
VHQRQVPFERVAGLAATRTYDLASSFRPSYNMAVNLVRNYSPEQSHHLLNSSFAQFLADRGVVVLERSRQQDMATLEGYRTNMTCHLGDFEEYWGHLEKARRLREDDRRARDQGRRDDVRSGVAGLRPGDVVWVARARRRGLAVVVSSRDGKPTVLAQDRQFFRLTARDFDDPPQVLTKIPLPRSGSVRNPRFRRDVAARLVALDVKTGGGRRRGQTSPTVEREAARLEALAEAHPCRGCPERAKHERWAARAAELQRRLGGVERRIRVRTETLARQFDRVLSVLRALGYVEGWGLTTKGTTLTRIYGEGDLLVGEALASGLLDDLRPSEVVALLSAVIYEGRERIPLSGEMPTAETKERYERLQRLWRKVRRTEDEHQVQLCRELEAGFARPIYQWAEGETLDEILVETEMAPGDFIRNCKQLVDLLRQIEDVAAPGTAAQVRAGRESILRGVVAYTGV